MKNYSEGPWVFSSIREMADHLERNAHPAVRVRLEQLHAAASELEEDPDADTLRSLVGQLGAALVAQMNFEAKVLLPRMRAVERARHGEGPWPDPGPPLEHSLRMMRQEHAHARALLDALRASCTGRTRLHEEADALGAELERDVHFEEDALFPHGLGLEPNFGLR